MNAHFSSVRSEIFVVQSLSFIQAPLGRHIDVAPDGALSHFVLEATKMPALTGLWVGQHLSLSVHNLFEGSGHNFRWRQR